MAFRQNYLKNNNFYHAFVIYTIKNLLQTMKKYFLLLFIIIGLNLNAQTKLPIYFKTTDQSTTKPENDGELFFINYYQVQPINIYFDGLNLNMFTDRNRTILNTNVKSYTKIKIDDDGLIEKWTLNVSKNDTITRYDTINIIIDHRFKWLLYQIILPTKDKYGENYTSYRKFSSDEISIK